LLFWGHLKVGVGVGWVCFLGWMGVFVIIKKTFPPCLLNTLLTFII
jgi:hypothetical protein